MAVTIEMREISAGFTVEDIHKIREENWERQKNMTPAERVKDTDRRAREAMKRLKLVTCNKPTRESRKAS